MSEPHESISSQELPRSLAIGIAIFCALGLVLTCARLWFGVDFSDEAYYAALPWRFVLGDRPFIDEINPVQSAALITLPFVRLFVWATGGIDGVILFLRVVYFVFTLGLASIVFGSLTRFVARPIAVLIALLCVVFMPLALPSPGYNTLASIFFCAGAFLGLRALIDGGRPILLIFAGAAHALSFVAIQTYAVPVLCFACLAVALVPRGARGRCAAFYLAGGIATLALFIPHFVHIGQDTLDFAAGYAGGAGAQLDKIVRVFREHWQILPRKLAVAATVIALVAGVRRRWTALAWMTLTLLPLCLIQTRGVPSATCYVSLIALAAPILYALLLDRAPVAVLFRCIWIPSCCAGLIAAWTSGNGVVNSGFGFLPGALVTSVLAARLAAQIAAWKRSDRLARFVFAWPFTIAIVLCIYQRNVYCDDPVPELDTRVESGPFRGLYTTAEKRGYVVAIAQDIASVERPNARVLFCVQFPGGYLMTHMRPAGRSMWGIAPRADVEPEDDVETVRDDLERHPGDGLVMVRLYHEFYSHTRTVTSRRGLIDERIDAACRRVLDRRDYTIFMR